MNKVVGPRDSPDTLPSMLLVFDQVRWKQSLHCHSLLDSNKLATSVTIWPPKGCFSHVGVSSSGRVQTVTLIIVEGGAVLWGGSVTSFIVRSGTYKRKGWFHVTVRPSFDSSPEHVILDTSPTQTVMRISSLGHRDDTVNQETTKKR